jgi:excisionase family DNA binding protein
MNTAQNASESWMTVDQVADYLSLSRSTIYQYVNEHRIPFVRIPTSNQVRFRRDQVDDWLENGYVATVTETLFSTPK